jgi:hypothetical protein
MGYDVSALGAHIDENKAQILSKMIGGAKSIASGQFNLITGVKYKAPLHLFTKTLSWRTGGCVNTSDGSTAFSDKEIETVQVTHYDELCTDDFNAKWYGATLPEGSLYDESAYLDVVRTNIEAQTQRDIENALWRGDSAGSTGIGMLDKVDGVIKKLEADGTFVSGSSYGTTFASANAIAIVDDLVSLAPEAIAEEDLTLFMGRADYNTLKVALRGTPSGIQLDAGDIEGVNSFRMPAYDNVTVAVFPGLNGAGAIALTYGGNFQAAIDGSEDDKVQVGYSEKEDVIFERIKMKLGTQVAFEEHVVLHKN